MQSDHLLLYLLFLHHSIVVRASPVKSSANSQSRSSFTPSTSSLCRLHPDHQDTHQSGKSSNLHESYTGLNEEIPPVFSPLLFYEQKPQIHLDSLAKRPPHNISPFKPNVETSIDLDHESQLAPTHTLSSSRLESSAHRGHDQAAVQEHILPVKSSQLDNPNPHVKSSASTSTPSIPPQETYKTKSLLDFSVTTNVKFKDGTIGLVKKPLSEIHAWYEKTLPDTHVARLYSIHPVNDHPDNAQENRSRLLQDFKTNKITEEEYHTYIHNSIEKVKAMQHVEDGGVAHTVGDQLVHQPSKSKDDAYKALKEDRVAYLRLKDGKEIQGGERVAKLEFINAKPDSNKAKRPKNIIPTTTSPLLSQSSRKLLERNTQKRRKSIYDRDFTSKDEIEVPAYSPPSFTSKVAIYLNKTSELKVNSAVHHRKMIEETSKPEDWQYRFVLDPIFDHSNFLAEKKRRLNQDLALGKISKDRYNLDTINANVKAKALEIIDKGGIIRGVTGEIHYPETMSPEEAHKRYTSSGIRSILQLRPKGYTYTNGVRDYQMEIVPADDVHGHGKRKVA